MLEKIVIKPRGGLANRMRALDSAYALAKIYNIRLQVIWEQSAELNCPFNLLFVTPETIDIKEYSINSFLRRLRNLIIKSLIKIGIYLPLGFDKYFLEDDFDKLTELRNNHTDILSKCRTVYFRTMHQFFNSPHPFEIFIPTSQLILTIEKYTRHFNSYSVGIHIRRSDNVHSIKFSPLEKFIELLNEELNNHPESTFFLATDSPEVEQQLVSIFREKILFHKKILDRNRIQGIQDALIDLYCLSRTSKIIGSYYSSFSEVAAQINNVELVQVYQA